MQFKFGDSLDYQETSIREFMRRKTYDQDYNTPESNEWGMVKKILFGWFLSFLYAVCF